MSLTPEQFIIQEEGESGRQKDGSYKSVWDEIGGVWTVGPGLTQGVGKGTIWSQSAVEAATHKELKSVEAVAKSTIKVPLGANRFAVCCSFIYNVGEGDWLGSSVLKYINQGKFNLVPQRLALYVHGRNQKGVVKGLVNRRAAEIRLWNTPDDLPHPAPVNVAKEPVPKATLDRTGLFPMSDATTPTSSGGITGFIGSALGTVVNFFTGAAGSISTALTPSAGPTVTVPAGSTTLVLSQFETFITGIVKMAAGAVVAWVAAHSADLITFASSFGSWAGILAGVVAQIFSHVAVSNTNAITLDTVSALPAAQATPPVATATGG